ncbi:MAG: hypothetical protein M3164_02705 [Actinomycetota bacterium]|nr:hypothetical protein [Actinomycetota bacterium]
MDSKYPGIIAECLAAISQVHPRRTAGLRSYGGWVLVYSYWKHWPCLFPQHGSGPKHERPIRLDTWQKELAEKDSELLLKGLIHSDGCRSIYRVKGRGYPRYYFSNYSKDIREIFCAACDNYGVRWRQMNWRTISIARREDVRRLDVVIGPKR